ncbi:DNA-dependent ATPase RDH54 NDAI_0A07510 [Naumovozyma dairenensis CBS 421]|uniref:DNA repair and recombination protein RDH54 n=1 Tax=Naumovozyma dairenensis (strain ATCC 10597 / BCRC 20456 / CBS 421 / NBRC 0211 / NRRL Y-12639) TaxID=1071378 RepID=G0W517_NAUDC|nr:hypothetical protein NDAI_0A07510 [Naumovozyma dairenensis CBS 421]CCD22905.1 hypothetical protein NDAI_0A07510 [Naumovozyma dairenensis CBS 421]
MMNLPKYENKPFKPPRKLTLTGNAKTSTVKRSISRTQITASPLTKRTKTCATLTETPSALPNQSDNNKLFTIMYRKPSMKKHKTWDKDGYAELKQSGILIFYNESGARIGRVSKIEPLLETIHKAGSWEVQLDYELTDTKEITKIRTLLKNNFESASITPPSTASSTASNVLPSTSKAQIPITQLFTVQTVKKFKTVLPKPNEHTSLSTTVNQDTNSTRRNYLPVFVQTKIKNPLVMNKSIDADVDVIVDPLISKFLRKHQREGVKFIYDCINGLSQVEASTAVVDPTQQSMILEKNSDINGCLLADEMGLGKTLMTIAVIWTLYKQTPLVKNIPCSQSGVPLSGLCKKFLIICPVTLIGNWKREFKKWLNLNRIGILTLNSNNTPEMDRNAVKNFLKVQRTYQVLIMGYEKVLSVSAELTNQKNLIDMLVCDEGHRLKSGTSKVLQVLKNLDVKRKILLSGTPIQNDLNEFYTIIDFINPGILGSFPYFKKRYMVPITRARDTSNRYNEEILELGEERSREMIEITKQFTLRRTNSILTEYLPPRTDIILFCKPTETQLQAFDNAIRGAKLDFNTASFNSTLGLITLLKKICNSPSLIKNDSYFTSKIDHSQYQRANFNVLNSGKLMVLMSLLKHLRTNCPEEKIVIVSNYTQTLDIIENLLLSEQMIFCRLDGSTLPKQRDSIVMSFNRNPSTFAFLLSAKSGGVGLNLVGASRLVLFDNDWNPSIDLQAMSRIHRDGQKRPCYIYRLITTGCIDEKILQRQLMKHNLSQKFLDSSIENTNVNDDLFDKQDLRDLFSINHHTKSNTHDLICTCDGLGDEIQYDTEAPDSVPPNGKKCTTWNQRVNNYQRRSKKWTSLHKKKRQL